ncbi:MAG: hypothetical protein RL556_224 [Actinomycetota bacterium]|jgi:ribonuclease-3
MQLDVLANRLGVEIEPQLLELALTHRSYAYEQGGKPSNERLEFLGDSVLGFVVTAHIHDKFTELDEGELTKIKNAVVSAKALGAISLELGIGEFLRLGKGETLTGGRDKNNLLADAFEAILGAVFVSKGLPAAAGMVERFVFPLLTDPDTLRAQSDPKTTLVELVQLKKLGAVDYQITFDGPDHDRNFFAELVIGGKTIAKGQGRSKKAAENDAAISALQILQGK